MLGGEYIIGLVIAFSEIFKAFIKKSKFLVENKIDGVIVSLFVVALGGLANAINAYAFTGEGVKEAVKQGMELAIIAAGIYGLGKGALEKVTKQ